MPLAAQEEEGEIIIISERVGKEIDQEENEKFKIFEGVKGFQSAVYLKMSDGRYFLKIIYQDEKTGEIKISRVLQSEASIKNRRDYIDRFEENQASKKQNQEEQKYIYSNPGISLYFELGGKSWSSINIDKRINKSKAMSLGFLSFKSEGERTFQPSIMFYKFSGRKYRTEWGIGLSAYINENSEIGLVCVHGVVGYRYQQKNGLLFRIGYTPFLGYDEEGDIWFLPILAGISLGYSF